MSRKNHQRQTEINEELESPKLPQHFADQVFNLERELEHNCTAQNVSKLIELYSAAVEYYGSIMDNRFIHYKEKLQKLLSRDDYVSAVNDKVSEKNENKTNFEDIPVETCSNIRSKSTDLRLNEEPENDTKRDAAQVIKEHMHTSSSISFKICEMLRNQEGTNLENRLKARKKQASTHSTPGSRTRSQTMENITKIPTETKFEKYQEEIEKIMEKYVDEKVNRIQTIKNQYREEINEVNMMGHNDTIAMVLNQLEKDMQREIDEVMKQIDRERKVEISELKKKFR
mmetsp:Transcript_7387/g.7247  ORF Transcript_7387/g.7247 Transcript_7387/m.7247 type:complete len:285 (+) Transcript_7387:22-876(+)